MNNELDKLLKILEELIYFLEKYGDEHWAKWFIEAKNLLFSKDLRGLKQILNSYGGMGSINDLVIHPENGHKVNGDLSVINNELMRLRSNLYEQAKKINKTKSARDGLKSDKGRDKGTEG